jgi:branched-chain amino acid transport system ATP-binding protein
VVALADVDLEIAEGQIMGLIGPNGSGKTTLVNVISGVFRPNAGRVTFRGRDVTGLAPHAIARLGIARTFQVVRPFQNLTALENVAVGAMFGGAGLGEREAMARAREVLDEIGLGRRADALGDALTIPDRKRLELARALAARPALLLLDEVMAGLRGGELGEAIALIRRIAQRGVTILLIEHVMRVIVDVCDAVTVLDRGRRIAAGTPREVMADPAVIRAYLGGRYAAAQS